LVEATSLTVSYGGVHALQDVDIRVDEGALVGLVGPNGAGKTTLLECLAGYVRPSRGRVLYSGRDVTRLGPDARARRGMVRSFQDARLFPTMPVWDALLLAQERRWPTRTYAALLALPWWRSAERRRNAAVSHLVSIMGLEPYADKVVGELSTGVRRVLDLACTIALAPRLLLLDEPSAGLASAEATALAGVLARVRDVTGATIVMVEHDLPLIWSLADVINVMEEGEILATGTPAELRHHPGVALD
jgi:ABC-type branched-subunit amino acid transport system ATPase component